MTIEIKIKTKSILKKKELLDNAIISFHKDAGKMLVPVLKDLIGKGISPVKGINKFQKYSKNYIEQIEGKAKFITLKNGYVLKLTPKLEIKAGVTKGVGEGKSRRARFQNPETGVSYRKGASSKISYRKEQFEKGLGVGKLKSPVNLKVSGDMLNSLQTSSGRFITRVYFTDKKARWHNEGTKKIPRRPMLPTRSNEEFSPIVRKKIIDLLNQKLREFGLKK